MSRRWPAPSLARCSPPGPGSAITRARAISMLAPAPWWTQHGGKFPGTEAELPQLPGIGAYTAAAIAAIAFGAARDAGRRQYRARGGAPVRRHHAAAGGQAGDQGARRGADARAARPAISRKAMMDLGATHLHARAGPLAGSVRWSGPIAAAMPKGSPRRCPIARRRRERPVRRGVAFVALRARRRRAAARAAAARAAGRHAGNAVLALRARPGRTRKSRRDHAPLKADWRKVPGLVEHSFTHFHLELAVYRADGRTRREAESRRRARALPLAAARRPCRARRCRR